jgi:putative ABC transport system permease protein
LALGATPAGIRRMVVGHGLSLTLAGIGIGVAAALLLADIMRGLLFGIEPIDGMTFGIGSAALALVALAGSYVPARRASRIDPAVAFRTE